MPPADKDRSQKINRRKVVQGLTVGVAGGLAGCSLVNQDDGDGGGDGEGGANNDGGDGGDGNGGQQNLGERVPTLTYEYWSDLGGNSTILQNFAPILKENVENNLGITLEVNPAQTSNSIGNMINDTHAVNFIGGYYTNTPDRLDPQEQTMQFTITRAGANGKLSTNNYANCEYTTHAHAQASAPTIDDRKELVTEAHSVMSNDYGSIPIAPNIVYGALRSDMLEAGGIGVSGIVRTNPYVYIKSTPKQGDTFVAYSNPQMMETTNFPVLAQSAPLGVWNHLVHSTLTEYDAENNLKEVLAKNYEIEDGGTRITVELRDATFTNGDPITAKDVKFTYSQLANNVDTYPQVFQPPYESINQIDDKTVEFRLEEPFLGLVSKVWPRWGVFHKKSWVEAGAQENPGEVELDPIVSSGPFKLDTFESGSRMRLVPHDGHPVHNPSHNIVFQGYQDQQSAIQAFNANELQIISRLSPGQYANIRDNLGDNALVDASKGFMPFLVWPQASFGPQKFSEFRHAFGAVLNRQEMNQVAFRGEGEPLLYSMVYTDSHPYYPPEDRLAKFTDDPQGSREAARQVLSEAGWGWDDQGNLHFPADADLSPIWPEGETPPPEEFPCINGDGQYVPPEDR